VVRFSVFSENDHWPRAVGGFPVVAGFLFRLNH